MAQTLITIGKDCKGAIKIMNAVNNGFAKRKAE